jgi:tryptophanyl-tRNA synthetase
MRMAATDSSTPQTAPAPGRPTLLGGDTPVRRRVLSGIQPSGRLHLGNLLGAIEQWVNAQDEYENYFCIVNLHAMTLPFDPQQLRQQTRELAAVYLAAGIDPERSTIFVQSQVPAHSELAWILNCITPLGWLYRMTQFKVKRGDREEESVSTGLLDYPVLMAADILLYQAYGVPVGEDQRQHIELTRDLAERFNRLFGPVFTVPVALIPDEKRGARVMGLDDPTVKMSKTITAPNHAVYLLDPPDVIRRKFMRATTDSGREIRFDRSPEKAGVFNLLSIYAAVTGQTPEWIEDHFAGKGYADLKREVAEAVIARLEPLQRRYQELMETPELLDDVLERGRQRASAVANATLRAAQEATGLLVSPHA